MSSVVVPEIGDIVLRRFRIEARGSGSGGEGAGFKSVDTVTGQAVFVKIYHALAHGTNEAAIFFEGLRKLQRRVADERLADTLVAPIQCGESDGAYVCVFPFVNGLTLTNRMGAEMSISTISSLARTMTGAVLKMHHAGIWHLDLQPANMLVGEDDKLSVIDLDSGALDGRPFRRCGVRKAGYASPERYFNDDGIGECSDIFSLGCILYELLFRKQPFLEGDAHGEDICRGRFAVPASNYNSRVIEAIVSCLDPIPSRRPDAGLVLGCLESCPIQTSEGDRGRGIPAVPGHYRPKATVPYLVPVVANIGNIRTVQTSLQGSGPSSPDGFSGISTGRSTAQPNWDWTTNSLDADSIASTRRRVGRGENVGHRWVVYTLFVLLGTGIAAMGFHFRREGIAVLRVIGLASPAQSTRKVRAQERDAGTTKVLGLSLVAASKTKMETSIRTSPVRRMVKDPWVVLVGTSLGSSGEAHKIASGYRIPETCKLNNTVVKPCIKRISRDGSYPILLTGMETGLTKAEAKQVAKCIRRNCHCNEAIEHASSMYAFQGCIE